MRNHSTRTKTVACLILTVFLAQPAHWAGAEEPTSKKKLLYSDEEIRALSKPRPFRFEVQDLDGIAVPMVNGRGITAISFRAFPFTPQMNEYYCAIFANLGFNAIAGETSGETNPVPVTPDHIRTIMKIIKRFGMGFYWMTSAEAHPSRVEAIWANLPGIKRAIERHAKGYQWKTWGDFLDPYFVAAQRTIYKAVLKLQAEEGNVLAHHPMDEISSPKVMETNSTKAAYRKFAAAQYGDASPQHDTNSDGVTYNRVMKTQYRIWKDIALFTPDEMKQLQARKRFYDYFKAVVWSKYLGETCKFIRSIDPRLSYHFGLGPTKYVSIVAAADGTHCVDPTVYSTGFNFGYYAGASRLFGKPALTSWTNVSEGNYDSVRFIAVRQLPYCAQLLWWHFTPGIPESVRTAWGFKYNLGDDWEFNTIDLKAWKNNINRIVKFDPRMKAISQTTPYVGRFSSAHRERQRRVLWISPPIHGLPVDDYWVSEEALTAYPEKLDLSRFRVIIYTPGHSAFNRDLYERLAEYVRGGGTVVFDGLTLASGPDYLGRDNSIWARGFSSHRDLDVGTSPLLHYRDDFDSMHKWYRDRKNFTKDVQWPSMEELRGYVYLMPHGATGSFEYHFYIPDQLAGVLIQDKHTAWLPPSDTILEYSGDAKEWKPLYADTEPWDHYPFRGVISVEDDLKGSRRLYLRYTFRDRGKGHRRDDDPREVMLWEFQVDGLTSAHLQNARFLLEEHSTTIQLGEIVSKHPKLYRYLLPDKDAPSGLKTFGTLSNTVGDSAPAFVSWTQGKGRWIMGLSPGLFDYNTGSLSATKKLISEIIASTGVRLIDEAEPYILQSVDGRAVLAFRDGSKDESYSKVTISARAEMGKPIVVDAFDYRVVENNETGQEGFVSWTADLSGGAANYIWLIKDASRPILLYADGTEKYGPNITDGTYTPRDPSLPGKGLLTFECAQRAMVYSSSPPKSVSTSVGKVSYKYDSSSGILKIDGPGLLAKVTVEF